MSVHPHIRGRKRDEAQAEVARIGTSPHTWEKGLDLDRIARNHGTSPHTWEKGSRVRDGSESDRYIPTYVGKKDVAPFAQNLLPGTSPHAWEKD